jgi:hypothetical protein
MKSERKSPWMMVGVMVIVLSMVTAAFGQPRTVSPRPASQPAAADSNALSSVLVSLRQDEDAFTAFLKQNVAEQIERIPQLMRADLDKAKTVLEQLKKDPQSRELASQYEDHLSHAVAQAGTILQQFTDGKATTLAAFDRVTTTVTKAQVALDHESHKAAERQVSFEQKASESEKQLRDLARQAGPLLARGEKLPPQLDIEVRKLEVARRIAEGNAKILKTSCLNAGRNRRLLDQQSQLLARIRGDLDVAYEQAQGQLVQVALIADARKQGLMTRELTDQLKSVQEATDRSVQGLGQLNVIIGDLGTVDFEPAGDGKDVQESSSQESEKILKRYLESDSDVAKTPKEVQP